MIYHDISWHDITTIGSTWIFFILIQAVYSIHKSSMTVSSWNLLPVFMQKQAEITNGWFTRTCVDVDKVRAKIWPVAPGLEVKYIFFGRILGKLKILTFRAPCVCVFSHKASSLCWLSSRSPPWFGLRYSHSVVMIDNLEYLGQGFMTEIHYHQCYHPEACGDLWGKVMWLG